MASSEDSSVDEDMESRIELDGSLRRELSTLFKELRALAISGIEYYECLEGENNERFHSSFSELYEHLDRGVEPNVDCLIRVAHLFDYDPSTPGNGYRSIVKIVQKCCLHLIQLCRYIILNRESFLFRGRHYSKELRSYVSTLGQLRACLHYLKLLLQYCDEGQLYPDENSLSEKEYQEAEKLMTEVESLSQETFYGRCLGFQYCQSMVKPLTAINLAMATFSEGYGQDSTMMKLASSVIGASKYLVDPELRAKQVVSVTRNGDINFCKAFWQINENSFMHTLPLFVCPPVHLDKVIVLQPNELVVPRVDKTGDVKIAPPQAHSGPGPVNTRLLSYEIHEGQEVWRIGNEQLGNRGHLSEVKPKSSGLLIHIHGGGFVAQSSASHEVYLRHWAKDLGVPVFCIDYSLAPEHPFPRQLQEAFYAYCWALNNASILGTTAERVCLAGDSAGGNLCIGVAMKALEMGIRAPDGILSVYGCMLVKYAPSPSRILALMDPLLPIGILSKCLAAYAGLPPPASSFPFPQSSSSSSLASVASKSSQNLCDNCSREIDTQSSNSIPEDEPHIMVMSEEKFDRGTGNGSETKRFIRHKQTDSGDSGFQESFSHFDKKCQGRFFVGEEENVKDSLDNSPTSSNKMSSLVSKIKCGADQVDHQRQVGSSSPKRQFLSLDLGNKKKGLSKSPSSPVLRTHHPHLTSSPTTARILQDLQSKSTNSPLASPHAFAKLRHYVQSPMQQFHVVKIPPDPFMSPMLAGEELLDGLCPVYLVACQLDPLLDDSVMFAKKLRSLHVPVCLDILEDLCHGFLNFILLSAEAKKGSDLCVAHMREVLTPITTEFDGLHLDEMSAFQSS